MYAGLAGGLAGKCAVAKPDAQSPGPHSARENGLSPDGPLTSFTQAFPQAPPLQGKSVIKFLKSMYVMA